MRPTYFILTLLVAWTHGAVLPETKDIIKRDTDSRISSAAKLSKIKELLKELQDEEWNKEMDHQQEGTTTPPPYITEVKEPIVDKGVWHSIETDNTNDVISPRDLKTLKELKRILEKARQQTGSRPRQTITEDSSDDLDTLAVNSDEISEISWRDLARKIFTARDQPYSQRQQSDSHVKVPLVITKGDFVPFKDEIKASVEKNLMTDLALAIHSGITIDEIIDDFTNRAHSKD